MNLIVKRAVLCTPSNLTPTHFSAKVFSSSCAPGADTNSPLCAQCAGNADSMFKCKASSEERYYGYAGAFR